MFQHTHWPRVFHIDGRPLRDGEERITTVSLVASAVRAAAEAIADDEFHDEHLRYACTTTATAIVLLLKRRSIDASVVLGEYDGEPHAWVELCDGGLLDVTATQFDPERDDVYWTQPGQDTSYVPERRGSEARGEILDWGSYKPRVVRRLARRAERLISIAGRA